MRHLLGDVVGDSHDPDTVVDLPACYSYPQVGTWVRANMVTSLDGSAVLGGRSGGLSGPGDKQVFALLRSLCDVVLVGAGTARAEGYRAPRAKPEQAEARAQAGQSKAPVLALVSRRLDLDEASDLFHGGDQRTIVLTCAASDAGDRQRLATVADVVVAGAEVVDIGAGIEALASRGLLRVLCEGGPHLLADIVTAGRLDELCVTFAPRLVAGSGPRILAGPELAAPPVLRLRHLLEEDGNLFARYVIEGPDSEERP